MLEPFHQSYFFNCQISASS